jgi:rhodanese-related sulfurtransferase/DNA-binding transcriptional ArsR family regulator
MLSHMVHREFKDRLYPQFARIGAALSSEKRLELLDLLAQASRNVDALAEETGMSVANTSRHLQALLSARIVDTHRSGTRVFYSLADDSVLRLWLALRNVAESRLAEVDQISREFVPDRDRLPLVSRDELQSLIDGSKVRLIDVRPRLEYDSGHLPAAVAIPIEDLPDMLSELPRDLPIVAYCRGEYCLFADQAVALLRENGFQASRLEGGWPEWKSDGREVVVGNKEFPSTVL